MQSEGRLMFHAEGEKRVHEKQYDKGAGVHTSESRPRILPSSICNVCYNVVVLKLTRVSETLQVKDWAW